MNKKAQAATEYMIILAVVIIIALIVVGIMGGIPGIGSSAKTRASAAYWSSADVAIVSYSNNATAGKDTLKIKNNLRSTITVFDINLSNTGSTVPLSFNTVDTVLAAGETKTFQGTMAFACNTTNIGSDWVSNVWIKYRDEETGSFYYFRGDGNTLSGKCSG